MGRIAWKEMLWSARTEAKIRPVSCAGKNPLGTIMYSQTFRAIVAASTSSMNQR